MIRINSGSGEGHSARKEDHPAGRLNKTETLLKYHDLILCITTALEARDPYTSHHSARVAEMSEAICCYMGIPEDEKELCHISAHLHDIGKIGVRDDVLLKEGKLTDREWEMMKSHSEKGYQILMTVPSFSDVALIVRSHHERFDGRGYPDGLKGEEIPLSSRVIAIADSIDAMLSDRPYRRGMDPEVCRNEIIRNRGIMYDPAAAEYALDNWEDLLAKRVTDPADCSIRQSHG